MPIEAQSQRAYAFGTFTLQDIAKKDIYNKLSFQAIPLRLRLRCGGKTHWGGVITENCGEQNEIILVDFYL